MSGGNRKELRKKQFESHGKVGVSSSALASSSNSETPIFCFRHVINGYRVDNCDHSDSHKLLDAVCHLSKHTWQQIAQLDRKKGGFENMAFGSLRFAKPSHLTDDVQKLMVFRFGGDMGRMIGLRRERVFEVIAIDPKGSAYDHGS